MSPVHRAATWLLLTLAWLPGVPPRAQYDDEQTREHADQDRRYLERYLKQDPQEQPDDEADQEQRFLALAEELIRDRNYRAASSSRYRVQTDDPRVDPEAVAALLERFADHFGDFWGTRLELEPYPRTSRVLLFYSFYKFNRLLDGDFRFAAFRPKGHYGSWNDVITIHSDAEGDTGGDLADTVIHEAAHQLFSQRLTWQAPPPPWLGEGIASYFGFTAADDEGFRDGVVGSKGVNLYRTGKPQRAREAARRLDLLRRALRQREDDDPLFVRMLWLEEPSRFYSGNTALHYSASWLLVHYLFHGDDGGHAAAFLRWLDAARRGAADSAGLPEALGVTAEELEAAVALHARGIKVR